MLFLVNDHFISFFIISVHFRNLSSSEDIDMDFYLLKKKVRKRKEIPATGRIYALMVQMG